MSELEEYFYNWQQVNKIIIRGEHGGSAYRNTAKKMELTPNHPKILSKNRHRDIV